MCFKIQQDSVSQSFPNKRKRLTDLNKGMEGSECVNHHVLSNYQSAGAPRGGYTEQDSKKNK